MNPYAGLPDAPLECVLIMQKPNSRRLSVGSSLSSVQLAAIAQQHPNSTLIDQVFEMVAHQVRAGQLLTGRRIASVRQLALDCEISRDTATKAYEKLVAHGFLESRAGSGFYVTTFKTAPVQRVHSGTARVHMFAPHSFRARLAGSDGVMDTSLGSGHLPDEWLESAGVANAMRQVTKGNLRHLNKFASVLGYTPLREQLQVRLREFGVLAEQDQIMVTLGASEALNLIVLSYLQAPGETVLVDNPSSFMLRERLDAAGMNVIGVDRQLDGPDIEQLRALCEQHRPRFFLCSSVLHNPTSSSIATHKAFQILRLADEFDLTIVEDDTYGDLSAPARSGQFARLAALDQLRRVIYIGSFSKTLGAGLRVGFVAASPERLQWLALFRHATLLSGTSIAERAVYNVLSIGNYRHHCEQLRSRLDAQRELVVKALERIGLSILQRHDAGMYIWASLRDGLKAQAVAEEMFRRGYLTAPGPVFTDGSDPHGAMRFNVASTCDGAALSELDRVLTELSKRQ
ncbi:MAG: PLP-dependent aminotransferase family protein [Casimicrobiaceae bacterium]